uniref:PPP1R35_C domain-containing protein n=1 Tax=Strongyloides papillosus TaxID=174720 RepID=A0A0N5BYW9_STREA
MVSKTSTTEEIKDNYDNMLTTKDDDIFAIRSNKVAVQAVENQKIDDHEKNSTLIKQYTILNYFKPIRKMKSGSVNKNIADDVKILPVEPNENDMENRTATSSLNLSSQQQNTIGKVSLKRDSENNQSVLMVPNDEPPIKKKLLELKLTDKERRIINFAKFEEKIGVYRSFDELPLPDIYIQEKNKITFDEYTKIQIKNLINNISYNPINDLEANTDFLLDDEDEESYADLYVPLDEASPGTPFAGCQYILDAVNDKCFKKK